MLQNQRQALGTLEGLVKSCKTCQHIHATKSKTDTLGLWMGLVKLVKIVNTFMLQNQRQAKYLYRIDSNTSLYRIILDVFTQTKIPTYFVWCFQILGYWFCRKNDFAVSDVFSVEGSWFCRRWHPSLESRHWFTKDFFAAWPWGPLLNRGVQHPPQLQGGYYTCNTCSILRFNAALG